jgi:hypothetical protein
MEAGIDSQNWELWFGSGGGMELCPYTSSTECGNIQELSHKVLTGGCGIYAFGPMLSHWTDSLNLLPPVAALVLPTHDNWTCCVRSLHRSYQRTMLRLQCPHA